MNTLLLAVLALAAPAAALSPQPPTAKIVRVGAYLNDVQDLDVKSHDYAVDIYLWFRWSDPKLDPAATFEFINPSELWGHVRTPVYEKPVRLPDGELYQLVRVQGRFSNKLDLARYPFDRQVLAVELEDAHLTARELAFQPDEEAVSANPALELPGYRLGKPRLTAAQNTYPTLFGDPRAPRDFTYSRVRVEVPVSRPMLPYGLKLLLPVLCVVLSASLMFLFHPQHLDARVGIGITALLTVVALQITLNEDLPEIAYLILMDKIYLASYLFVIAGLAVVVRTTWLHEKGREAQAHALSRQALLWLTGLFLAATGLVVALSL